MRNLKKRNFRNLVSRFKRNTSNKIENTVQKFKKNVSEAKSKPRSKRRSLFLGFTTVFSIFGITRLASVLPAVAQDLPNPGEACPAPAPAPAPVPAPKPELVPSQQIIDAFSGAAASICGLAVSSGSFVIGAVCGVIVVVGILKAQGK